MRLLLKEFGSLLMAGMPVILYLQCVNAPVANNGSGSTTETAMVYNPGGSPAVNAMVRFYPVTHVPKAGLPKAAASIDSATTDKNGNYTVTLDTGTYNILVSGDSGLAYQDSITIKPDTTSVPADTLGAPGSITGVVRLQPGDDARTVFILFMGTNTWGTPDDSTGKFTIANMAEGSYRVRILTTLDQYIPKDTVLSVTAGKVDTLPHDIVLQYTGIPVPSGLAISYDTLKQIVTLTWNRPTTGRMVAGYNVYRKFQSADSGFVKIKSDLADTVYRDSAAIQDQTYVYRVAAVDSNGTEGVYSTADSVGAVGAFALVNIYPAPDSGVSTKLLNRIRKLRGNRFVGVNDYEVLLMDTAFNVQRRWGTQGSGASQFNGIRTVAVDNYDYIYVSDCGNNRIEKFDTLGNSVRTWGTLGSGQGQFSCPGYIEIDSSNRVFACDVPGNNLSRIQVFDAAGTFLSTFGANGSGDGQFNLITGLAIDTKGYLYLADGNNERIEKISVEGAFVSKWSGSTTNELFSDSDFIIAIRIENDGTKPIVLYKDDGTLIASSDLGIPIGFYNQKIYVRQTVVNQLTGMKDRVVTAYRCPVIP